MVLGGLSLFVLGWLVIARVLRNRSSASRKRRRAEITEALLKTVREDGCRALTGHLAKPLLLAEVALEFADLVRGPELARLQMALVTLCVGQKLISRLAHGWKRQRVLAAEALGLIPTEASVSALVRARQDRAQEVRFAALFSLLRLERPPMIAEILETVRAGGWRGSLLVTELLRRFGHENPTELASEIDRSDLSTPIQIMLLNAVGNAGNSEGLVEVIAQTDDLDSEVRGAAIRALGRLGHPAAGEVIARALEDANDGVRLDAVIAAQRVGLQDLAPALQRRLDDDNWDVRYAAALALADLGAPGSDALREAIRNAGDERSDEIERAVGETSLW